MMKLKSYIKEHTPRNAWKCMHETRMLLAHLVYLLNNMRTESRIRKKRGPLNVLSLVSEASNWKCDFLYQLMLSNADFNPKILIYPEELRGDERMLERLKLVRDYFKSKGCSYINCYNEDSKTYLDIRTLEPDIIFYTSPYRYYINERYFITHQRAFWLVMLIIFTCQ